MIQPQSILNIADNTGAKKIMCIRILKKTKNIGYIGDIFIGVIKKALSTAIIKKASVVKAVIVRTTKIIKREHGNYIKFDDNAAVILTADNNIKGTRILSPIANELRRKNFGKLISLASEII